MTRHEATFPIEDQSDANAAHRICEFAANVVREELRVADADAERDLEAAFIDLEAAIKGAKRGRLVIAYDPSDTAQ